MSPGEKKPLPFFGISSSEMTPEANYAAWGDATATMFDIDAGGRTATEPFYADLVSYAMGPVLIGRARAAAQTFTRSASTIARSGVDHILVQLYQQGGYRGIAGTLPIEVNPGDICILDFAETLETTASSFENITMVVPRGLIELALGRTESLHGLVLKNDTALCQLLARHLKALFELAPHMTFDESDAIANGTISLIAACLRGELETRDDTASGVATVSLIRIRRFIDQSLEDPELSIESIAKRFGLSRASLYRLFDSFGGIAEYIRRKRLHRAFFLITDPSYREKRIGEIARRFCFPNESTFTRAFKGAYGITPSAAREASLLRRPDSSPLVDELSLTHWMRQMAKPSPPPTKTTPKRDKD